MFFFNIFFLQLTQSVLPTGTDTSILSDVTDTIGSVLPIFENCVDSVIAGVVEKGDVITEAILNCKKN